MDKIRWREISFLTHKTNFLYFQVLRIDNTYTDIGESKLISEICYTIMATNSHFFPFFPKFPSSHAFGIEKKLSAAAYFKYSVYRENLTKWNQFWEFYHMTADRKNKQKALNKHYLNSGQCKIFRKTCVSNTLKKTVHKSCIFSLCSCSAMNQQVIKINLRLRITKKDSHEEVQISPMTPFLMLLISLPREKVAQPPSLFNNSSFLMKQNQI